MVMSPTLIHYHMDHSKLSLCFFVMSFFNSEKPGFYHLSHIYLIFQLQYEFWAVFIMLTHIPMGNNFMNYSTQLMYSFFCPNPYILLSFPKLLRSASFSPIPSVRQFYTFLVRLDHFITLCIPSWDSLTSKLFF